MLLGFLKVSESGNAPGNTNKGGKIFYYRYYDISCPSTSSEARSLFFTPHLHCHSERGEEADLGTDLT